MNLVKTSLSISFILGSILLPGGTSSGSAKAQNADYVLDLRGCVIYQDGWTQQQNSIGMYSIPSKPGGEFVSLGSGRVDASAGGVLAEDTYWCCYFVDFAGTPFVMLFGYNPETWEETYFQYGEANMISTGMVYDRTGKKIYGCFRNDSNTGYVFGTMDFPTRTRTKICDLTRMWSAIAISRDGEIYAIDELGVLYSVNKATGVMTRIGDTGLKASNPSSACIDPRSGKMYYALTAESDGSLYEINLESGIPTLLYHFPKNQEVVGMYCPNPAAEDKAPDVATDVSYTFSGASLAGTVTFTAPAATYDGTSGTGDLSYTVMVDDQTAVQGTCNWGEKVTKTISVASKGMHTFKLYLSNAIGDGPAVEESFFVGPDNPVAPVLTVERVGDNANLSWSDVTSTIHGGYADYDNLRYTLIRQPDNKTVADGKGIYSAIDQLPGDSELTAFTYELTASYDGVSSEKAVSEKLWCGGAIPPFSSVFDSFEASEPYIVEDANNDGKTWFWDEYSNAFKTYFNRAADTDDWLFTPALNLKGGSVYKFTAKMRTYNGNPEEAEIKWGTSPSPASMTGTIMNKQIIKTRTAQDFSGFLTPSADGIYHVGIHCTTPSQEAWYLFVDEIEISAPSSNDIPAEPENFTAISDYEGSLAIELTFNAPDKTAGGKELTKLNKIEVTRDGAVITKFDNPAPGAQLTYTDIPTTIGSHIYRVIPFNDFGEGKFAELTAFAGVKSPAKPAWAKVEETDKEGTVKITWEKVTKAADGSSLNPDLVTYDIMTVDDTHNGEAYAVAEGLKDTTFTVEAPGTRREQKFVYYAIKAVTASDYSLMTLTPFIPVGPAYPVPYRESFSNGNAWSLMRPENGNALWSLYTDDSGIPSYDGDRGMAAMFGELDGASATLYSGKVSLKNVSNPMLILYTYNITGTDKDLNELYISAGVDSDLKEMKKVVAGDLGETDGWYPVMVSLKEFEGKEINFALRGVTRTRKFTLVDNINIIESLPADLKAGFVNAPVSVTPGVEFAIEAGIENIGMSAANDFNVILKRNGKEAASKIIETLEAGASTNISFSETLNVASDETNYYSISIDFADDADIGNNNSQDCSVTVKFPLLPSPENLWGAATQSGVSLKWDEPDLTNAAPEAITEDFEDWTPWSKEGLKGWTFIDGDLTGIGAIQNIAMPGIDYNSKLSWFVVDDTLEGLDDSFAAASGNKYISTFFCLPKGDFTYTPNDDWAISPKLYGGAQTILFKARSINENEAQESFEILYTTEDTVDTGKYLSLGNVKDVPGTWTEYEFRLPAGALHFAIRYDKTFGFMLHVDDVTFVPAGTAEIKLSGYNVYKDGELMTSSPISAREYSDTNISYEDMIYGVSAVYEGGLESRICTPLVLNTSVEPITIGNGIKVTCEGHSIIISGADGYDCNIYSASGTLIKHTVCSESEIIDLESGIYIVRIGEVPIKIIL